MINFALSNGTFVYFDNVTGKLGVSFRPMEQTLHDAESILRFKDFAVQKSKKRNFHVFLQTTLACHLACKGCFEEEAREHGQANLPRLESGILLPLEKFLEDTIQTRSFSPSQITLMVFGGEPLTKSNFGFVKNVFDFAERKGYWVGIVSSLVDLDQCYLDLFRKYSHLIEEVDVTVEGTKAVHDLRRPFRNGGGTFDRVIGNVKKLLDLNIPVLCKTNLGVSNIHDLEGLLSFLENEGYFESKYFAYGVNMIRDFGSAKASSETLPEYSAAIVLISTLRKKQHLLSSVRIEGLKLTRYITAALGLISSPEHLLGNLIDKYPATGFCNPSDGTSVTFDPNGNLLRCNWMSTKPDLFKEPNTEKAPRALKVLPVTEKQICNDCSINTLCGGGCLVDRQITTNYLDGKCFVEFRNEIQNFLNSLLELQLLPEQEVVISEGFEFNYTYEHRSIWL